MSSKSLKSYLVATTLFASFVAVPWRSAQAESSGGSGCTYQQTVPQRLATADEVLWLETMGTSFHYGTQQLLDVITRLANNYAVNAQSENNALSATTDVLTAETTAQHLADQNYDNSTQLQPSIVGCATVSQQDRFGRTGGNYNAQRNNISYANTMKSMNAPGSGSENGQVQSYATAWKKRCNTYANLTTMGLTSSPGCTGATNPALVDLDVKPWQAIFKPFNLSTPETKQAAIDAIDNLIEPVKQDPMRGDALIRDEGKNIHVVRMQQLARMGLARGALEDIVAKRITPTTPDPSDGRMTSRLGRYIEMITGQAVNGNGVGGLLNSIATAGQMQGEQTQTITARLITQKMMLTEFLSYTEQLLALESVRLATKVDETKASPLSVSGRATEAN